MQFLMEHVTSPRRRPSTFLCFRGSATTFLSAFVVSFIFSFLVFTVMEDEAWQRQVDTPTTAPSSSSLAHPEGKFKPNAGIAAVANRRLLSADRRGRAAVGGDDRTLLPPPPPPSVGDRDATERYREDHREYVASLYDNAGLLCPPTLPTDVGKASSHVTSSVPGECRVVVSVSPTSLARFLGRTGLLSALCADMYVAFYGVYVLVDMPIGPLLQALDNSGFVRMGAATATYHEAALGGIPLFSATTATAGQSDVEDNATTAFRHIDEANAVWVGCALVLSVPTLRLAVTPDLDGAGAGGVLQALRWLTDGTRGSMFVTAVTDLIFPPAASVHPQPAGGGGASSVLGRSDRRRSSIAVVRLPPLDYVAVLNRSVALHAQGPSVAQFWPLLRHADVLMRALPRWDDPSALRAMARWSVDVTTTNLQNASIEGRRVWPARMIFHPAIMWISLGTRASAVVDFVAHWDWQVRRRAASHKTRRGHDNGGGGLCDWLPSACAATMAVYATGSSLVVYPVAEQVCTDERFSDRDFCVNDASPAHRCWA